MTKSSQPPDPYSFKKFHILLHTDGTHALCSMAYWKMTATDLQFLRDFNKRMEGDLIYHVDKKYYLYDVLIKPVRNYEAQYPQLIFPNVKRAQNRIIYRGANVN